MATDLEQKTRPTPKYETFVDQQIARARGRIRALDIGSYVLGFLVLTLVYALGMAAADRMVGLAAGGLGAGIRLAAFALYVLAALFFVGGALLCLIRRVNPYYAAKQLEEAVPDAKNSVVNWLDLREEKLPPVIRSSLGQRAARDLKQTDPERAVQSGRTWLLGIVIAGLVLALLILFVTGPSQFGSLMQRAFFPFKEISMRTRTYVSLVAPGSGHVTVPLNSRISFKARVEGRVPKLNQPDAPRLLYRYSSTDPYVTQLLEEDPHGLWGTTLAADQVQNGFWYKITAGDDETDEFQVQVSTIPQVLTFEAAYRHRPYLKHLDYSLNFPNQTAVFPRLHAHRGTQVTLTARTNRRLREGQVLLELGEQKKELEGQLLADDPKSVRFEFVLDRSGSFRVLFSSTDGEINTDRSSPYQIDVIADAGPTVIVSKPGEDIKLPANGTLQLEGHAVDDHGLKSLTLRLKVLEGGTRPALEPKPYRPGKTFKFDDGASPQYLDYKDFVALDTLKAQGGAAFAVQPGMVLEYWLEATDISDYPDPKGNLGKSQAYKVAIQPPDPDAGKQQVERKKAEDQQKQHEKKQDAQLNQQNKERNEQKTPEEKELDRQKKELEDKLNKFQDQIDKEKEKQEKDKQQQDQKGEAKGQDGPQSDKKDGGQKQDGQSAEAKDSKQGTEQAGQKKDEGKNGEGEKSAEAKDGGKKEQPGEKRAESKGPGKEQPANEAKDSQANGPKQEKQGSSKAGSNEEMAKAKDEGKGGQKPETQSKAGEQQTGEKQARESSPAEAKGAEAAGDKKCECKGGGQDTGGQPQAGAKDSAQATDSAANKTADPNQARDAGVARNESKHPRQKAKKPAPATKEDIAKLKEKVEDKLRNGEKGAAEEELNELRRQSRNAEDPEVRRAAEKALEESGQANGPGQHKDAEPGQGEGAGLPKDGEQGKDKGKAKGGAEGAKAGKGKGAGDPEESTQEEAVKAEQKAGGKFGGFGPGGKGSADDLRAQGPDAEAGRRGGELTLEDWDKLKKKITPDMLKQAGVSPQQWDKWLKDRQAYEQNLQKLSKDSGRATKSKLGSSGPTQIKPGTLGGADPAEADRGQAPPELRPGYQRFTDPAAGKRD